MLVSPDMFSKKMCSSKFCKIHRKTPVPEHFLKTFFQIIVKIVSNSLIILKIGSTRVEVKVGMKWTSLKTAFLAFCWNNVGKSELNQA